MNRYGAWQGLIATIASASVAGGYHYNLAGRVLNVLAVPERGWLGGEAAAKDPYVCIPYANTNGTGDPETTGELRTWHLTAYLFVPETSNDPLISTAGERLAKLEDTVDRVVFEHDTLGGAVNWCGVANWNSDSGWSDTTSRYASSRVRFVLQHAAAE